MHPWHVNHNSNLEKLPREIKLIVARNVKETWDLTKILEIVNQELRARQPYPLKKAEDAKNGSDNYEVFLYTGSSLDINCQHHNWGQQFANIM